MPKTVYFATASSIWATTPPAMEKHIHRNMTRQNENENDVVADSATSPSSLSGAEPLTACVEINKQSAFYAY